VLRSVLPVVLVSPFAVLLADFFLLFRVAFRTGWPSALRGGLPTYGGAAGWTGLCLAWPPSRPPWLVLLVRPPRWPPALLTTPTCMNRECFAVKDLVVTDSMGDLLSGSHRVFPSELGMHLLFSTHAPDPDAIWPCPSLNGYGVVPSPSSLDRALFAGSEAVGLGQIPLCSMPAGTPDLSAVISPYAPHYYAHWLANHSPVTFWP